MAESSVTTQGFLTNKTKNTNGIPTVFFCWETSFFVYTWLMEIEIKVKIENVEPLLKLLKSEAEFKYEDRQIDEYYNPPHKNFLLVTPIEEWLRVRNSNGKYSINHKKWHYNADGKSNHCDEIETLVGDFDVIKKLLGALDFTHLITVDKNRTTWIYKDYEISIDTVDTLGDFVEIEYIGNDKSDPKKITEGMMDFLNNLNCGKVERDFKGYPYWLLEKSNLLKK